MQKTHANRESRAPGSKPQQRPAGTSAERAADSEVELKFAVPPLAREALMADLEKRQCRTRRLVSRYYDTPDGLLSRAGIALRLRQADGRWYQTLKAGKPGEIHDRHEHEVEIPGGDAAPPPGPDPARHDGTAAGKLLRQALGRRDAGQLEERFVTDFVRRAWDIAEGDIRIEAAFDQGRVVAGERHLEICELELELKSGPPAALPLLARPWVTGYGLWLDTESKAARGERLTGAREGLPVVKSSPPALDPAMTCDALLRAVVNSCLGQIVPNAAAVAGGSRNHDSIHQLRVGIRRLRTAMRELGDLSPELQPPWEEPMAATFRQLGDFRDREAVMENLRPELLAAGASGLAWMRPEAEAADPVAAVRDPQFQATLLHLLSFALGRAEGGASGPGDIRPLLRKRIKALHRRIAGDGARFRKLTEEAQHGVRKRLKRLRYLSEFVSSIYGADEVDTYLKTLRPAQDALGRHNDLAVAAAMARDAAGRGDPDAAFAGDWMAGQQKLSQKESARALRKLDEAPRYWRRKNARVLH